MVAAFVLGLVGGWLWHPVAERVNGTAPLVGWTQAAVLFFVAAIMGFLAWYTWQTVHVRGERLEPHQAVNRLVLARACVLVGAVVAGLRRLRGLLARLRVAASRPRILRSLVAAAGAAGVTLASLARACVSRGRGLPRA